jgi:hypothetical protein
VAGKTPFFLTGGNAKILVNNKTVAYATNVTYRISVKHASPRVLGRFEVEGIQPLAYEVTGTLSIIRYGRGLKSYFGESAADSVNELGNSIGSYGLDSGNGAIGSALGLPTSTGLFDGGANEAFDPSRMFQSKLFNIEIRQKMPGAANGGNNQFVQEPPRSSGDFNSGTLLGKVLKKGAQIINSKIHTDPIDEIPVIVLRDCRFEDLQFALNKRGVATLNMTFRARYVDDDTFIARKSGVGQELS